MKKYYLIGIVLVIAGTILIINHCNNKPTSIIVNDVDSLKTENNILGKTIKESERRMDSINAKYSKEILSLDTMSFISHIRIFSDYLSKDSL